MMDLFKRDQSMIVMIGLGAVLGALLVCTPCADAQETSTNASAERMEQ